MKKITIFIVLTTILSTNFIQTSENSRKRKFDTIERTEIAHILLSLQNCDENTNPQILQTEQNIIGTQDNYAAPTLSNCPSHVVSTSSDILHNQSYYQSHRPNNLPPQGPVINRMLPRNVLTHNELDPNKPITDLEKLLDPNKLLTNIDRLHLVADSILIQKNTTDVQKTFFQEILNNKYGQNVKLEFKELCKSHFHLYALYNMAAMVCIAIKAGVDINLLDNNNRTALHYTAFNNNDALAQWLINHGANKEAVTSFGFTPLHCAACENADKVVKTLIDNHANIQATTDDKTKLTALNIALQHRHQKSAFLLLSAGANDVDSENIIHPNIFHIWKQRTQK